MSARTESEIAGTKQVPTGESSSRLLDGIKVLDFSNVLSGPFASYQLSLLGATVIKVERPGVGDLARKLGASPELNTKGYGASFLAQNSGKHSIAVDLKHPQGKELVLRAMESVDVVLENFRPGVMDRLGLGWDQAKQRNPKLVYCSVSGFGQDGPLKERPAYDQIIQGLSGMMSVTGEAESDPTRAGFPVADTLGGMCAAFAISSALVGVSRNGEGSYLDVSMLETALTAMGWAASNTLIAGKEPSRMGNHNFTAAPSGAFRTKNGLINIAANEDRQFRALCAATGLEELLHDSRFSTRQERLENRKALNARLETVLSENSAEHWVEILSRQGVPAGKVASIQEALLSPQVRSRRLVHHVEVAGLEEKVFQVLGSPIQVNGEALGPRSGPPNLGDHTSSFLESLGYDVNEIHKLKAEEVLGNDVS